MNIQVTREEFTAKITLSKPPLNILDIDDLVYLKEVLEKLNREQNLKLILIDSDQKVFSAGVNISDHSKDIVLRMLGAFHEVFHAMLDLTMPTMSIVRSGCIGGGCELALFCDMAVASENAYFSQPEIKIGCFPPVALSILPELTSSKKALEIILSGNKLSANEALQSGLINHAFKEEEFDGKLAELINSITMNSASVIKATLKAYKTINYSRIKYNLDIAEKLYIEELMSLEDSEEGMKSFLEKRKPIWKNR